MTNTDAQPSHTGSRGPAVLDDFTASYGYKVCPSDQTSEPDIMLTLWLSFSTTQSVLLLISPPPVPIPPQPIPIRLRHTSTTPFIRSISSSNIYPLFFFLF